MPARAEPEFVVVLGPARSGTSLLRDLIGAHPSCAAIPFDVNHIWRSPKPDHEDDVLPLDLLDAPTTQAIRRRLQRMAVRARPDRRLPRFLIEKTVGNALRPDYVARVLPQARFVRIVRDPRSAIPSALEAWQASPDPSYLWRKARAFGAADIGYAAWFAGNAVLGRLRHRRGLRIWGVRYPGIKADLRRYDLETVCTRQWLAAMTAVDAFFDALPPGRGLKISYEEMLGSPQSIAEAYHFLGLEDAGGIAIAAHRHRVVRFSPRPWDFSPSLPEETRAAVEQVMRRHGYA